MAREVFRGNIPADRLYDSQHDMWVSYEDGRVRIGATAFGIHLAGKIIGFTAKPLGAVIAAGRGMATVECAKTVLAVHAPLGFDLLEANEAAEVNPDILNCDPYHAGWMALGQPHDWSQASRQLVDAAAYREHVLYLEPQAEFI